MKNQETYSRVRGRLESPCSASREGDEDKPANRCGCSLEDAESAIRLPARHPRSRRPATRAAVSRLPLLLPPPPPPCRDIPGFVIQHARKLSQLDLAAAAASGLAQCLAARRSRHIRRTHAADLASTKHTFHGLLDGTASPSRQAAIRSRQSGR